MLLALVLACSQSTPPVAIDLRLEEGLIATMPQGVSLEGPTTRDPNGDEVRSTHEIYWSPDGRQVAYVGILDGKTHPIVGEQVFDAYDYISAPRFGPTAQNYLFRVGNRSGKNKEKWWVLLEGEEFGKEDWIGEVAFGPDGESIAYWTQPGARVQGDGAYNEGPMILKLAERRGKKWKARAGQKWDGASSLTAPSYCAGGTIVASTVQDGDDWHLLVVDRAASNKKFERTFGRFWGGFSAVVMNATGTSWAVTSMLYEWDRDKPNERPKVKWSLTFDEKPMGGTYEGSGCCVYSPIDNSIAYKVLRNGKFGIVLDEQSDYEPEYDFVHSPVFRPDGEALAYIVVDGVTTEPTMALHPWAEQQALGGEHSVVTHAVRGTREVERGAKWPGVRHLTYDPTGTQLAYAVKSSEGWAIVVNGKVGEFFEAVGPPRFSADGKTCVFGAKVERELWWKVFRATEEAKAPAAPEGGEPKDER